MEVLRDGHRIIAGAGDRIGHHRHDPVSGHGVIRHEDVVGELEIARGEPGITLPGVIGTGEVDVASDGQVGEPSDRQVWGDPGAGHGHVTDQVGRQRDDGRAPWRVACCDDHLGAGVGNVPNKRGEIGVRGNRSDLDLTVRDAGGIQGRPHGRGERLAPRVVGDDDPDIGQTLLLDVLDDGWSRHRRCGETGPEHESAVRGQSGLCARLDQEGRYLQLLGQRADGASHRAGDDAADGDHPLLGQTLIT